MIRPARPDERESLIELQRGCLALKVVANQRALGFYEKCGFQALGEVATRFSPGVAMVRPL